MSADPIFAQLSAEDLSELAGILGFTSTIVGLNVASMSSFSGPQRMVWLLLHSSMLQQEICRLGSWSFGAKRTYAEVVNDLALKVGVIPLGARVAEVERLLVQKIWTDAVSKMSPAELEELRIRVNEIAAKFGKSVGAELTSFAALGAAQLSGFGIYILGSTILGALNGALGLGLGFGAFTGLSSLIATVIGPVGWAAVGLATVLKLGAPNYKKVLPAVLFIASRRAAIDHPLIGGSSEQRNASGSKRPIILPPPSETRDSSEVQATEPGQPDPLSVFDKRIADAIIQITAARKPRSEENESQTVRPSEIEKAEFAQRSENRALIAIAVELTGEHFLDLSDKDQQDVRLIASERCAEEARTQQPTEPNPLAQADLDDSDASGVSRAEIRRWGKHFSVLLPNVDFTPRALGRWIAYEKTNLHGHFLREFVSLNDGSLEAKHEVPRTSPKLFVKWCGDGRVYYRRTNAAGRVHVHLIGDQRTKESDYILMQKHMQ